MQRADRLALAAVLTGLFAIAATLGYERVLPLDLLDSLAPGAGLEVLIFLVAGGVILLVIMIGRGSTKARLQPVQNLPESLAAWTPRQPVAEWAALESAPPSVPFAVRPSPAAGRELSTYLDFYHLREPPFSAVPDPRFLLLTERHLAAIPSLQSGLASAPRFTVLIGDAGSGKTTLLRRFQRLAGSNAATAFIAGATTQDPDIHAWILQAFGIARKPGGSARDEAITFLSAQARLGREVSVLVDEAQTLTKPMLLDLQELVAAADPIGKVRVALAGTPSLKTTLELDAFCDLRKAGLALHEIPPLSYNEMVNYLNKRLSLAGARQEIFTEQAKESIYHFSYGRPGLVNMLCDLALAYGASDRMETIAFQTILDIVEDRSRWGLTPFRPANLTGHRARLAQDG